MSAQPKVLVSRKIPMAAIDLLAKHSRLDRNSEDRPLPRKELLQRVTGCDGLVCHLLDKLDEKLPATPPRLKVVSNVAVGFDNIGLPAATRRKVMATNTP